MKYEDPTASRISRDDAERKRERAKKSDKTKQGIKDIFREASSKGSSGPMKTTAGGYKAAAKNPRKVL